MDNKLKNHNRGKSVDDHDPYFRRKMIREILTDKSIQIIKLENLVKELLKRGIETTQSTVTKDKNKHLHFTKVSENGIECYRMPDTIMDDELDDEIRNICEIAEITTIASKDEIAQKVTTFSIQTNGYSHFLSDALKKRFPNYIIDTLPLQNILVVYCVGMQRGKPQNFAGIEQELACIINKNR